MWCTWHTSYQFRRNSRKSWCQYLVTGVTDQLPFLNRVNNFFQRFNLFFKSIRFASCLFQTLVSYFILFNIFSFYIFIYSIYVDKCKCYKFRLHCLSRIHCLATSCNAVVIHLNWLSSQCLTIGIILQAWNVGLLLFLQPYAEHCWPLRLFAAALLPMTIAAVNHKKTGTSLR